jgi:multimeric flavodoxin WrbA
MTELVLTEEGQEALEGIFSRRAPVTQEGDRKRVLQALSLLMKVQDLEEAGRELVLEAARLVLPPTYNSLIRRVEDPTEFKKFMIDIYNDMQVYYAVPRQVKRWDIPKAKEIRRPADMKVLAFNASPRVRGNTGVLIDEALRGAKDAGATVEKIRLQKIKLQFCTHCSKCWEPGFQGFCALKDDMSSYVYQKMVEANAIIIGFPIYVDRECGQLAVFFDRWLGFAQAALRTGQHKMETEQVAMIIGTWGVPWVDTYDHIIGNVINILNACGIITVEALSAGGFEGALFGLDDKRKAIIRRFPEELEKAYQAGKSLVTG